MKYKVGEWVEYKTLKSEEFECKCCGHMETEHEIVIKSGIIKSRGMDYAMTSSFGFNIKEEKQPDGSILQIPGFPETKVPQKENFYKINGENVIEDNIIC